MGTGPVLSRNPRRNPARGAALSLVLTFACIGPDPYDVQDSSPVADEPALALPAAEPPDDALATARADTARIREQGNHLLGQPSPYLEQHAHNPVDWHPWGDEAIAKAKAEHKPIFLSIGYSTCHWCHVMEHESFEDDDVAAFLNAHFVSIKVDREQRPDVDALYIDAVAALGGSTGWPLTVFLTPELEPFFGGTYFPRESKHGRPGFMEVLAQVRTMWTAEGSDVASRGQQVLAQIERRALSSVRAPGRLDDGVLGRAMTSVAGRRDATTGGFGNRQKFPNAPLLGAELRAAVAGDRAARDHLTLTLDQMLAGGIRDHVGGGFHRYAVDRGWHVPHFEKMLYDNAQLAALYVEAGRALERPAWIAAGRAVLDELLAQWRGAGQAFVVGFDADDPGGEGAFYSWTPDELTAVLGVDDAPLVIAAYDVTAAGERELGGRSVLHRQPQADVMRKTGATSEAIDAAISRALPKMRTRRAKRPPPARDDKVLVSWNGLAIMALADVGRWLDEPRYVTAATRAATFIRSSCWKDGVMQRGFRDDVSLGDGFLDDYALAGLAFVRLHAATGDPQWLLAARDIMRAIESRFFDADQVAFMRTPLEHGLPVRMADMDDGVLPSGGSAATRLALELGALSGQTELLDLGERVLRRAAGGAQSRPFGAGFLLQTFDHATGGVREVVVAGDPADARTSALWAEVAPTSFARVLPIRVGAPGPSAELAQTFPALAGKRALKDSPTAYVCERGSCQAPTPSPTRLRAQLQAALTASRTDR